MTPVRNSFCCFAIAIVALWMAGCASSPQRGVPLIPMETTPKPVEPVPSTNAVTVVTPPAREAKPPLLPPPDTGSFLTNPWMLCETGFRLFGVAQPQLLGNNGKPGFRLQSTNGMMTLASGIHHAIWNGTKIWLGFVPQIMRGQTHLHVLDIQKNLFPLLSAQSLRLKTNAVIVLDPGHGGKDSGAKSILGPNYEKEFTLDWALRVQRMLSTNGYKVYLTRSNDVDVALSNRVAMAERLQADLFVSLHFNSAMPAIEPSGLETYCLTPMGMPSSVTRGFEDNLSASYPNNNHDTKNLQYAVRFHQALLTATGTPDRMVRRARFLGVLKGQNRPAVLIEGGFLSNPHEAQQIADPNYRRRLSEAVVRALVRPQAYRQEVAGATSATRRGMQ
jgi:N-acetylmuramoyl-L-alanine amidase